MLSARNKARVKAKNIHEAIHPIIAGAITILFALLVLAHSPAHAADTNDTALKVQFEQAFQTMLKDPSNITATLNYAELAVALGDYEAAIPPYERILMYNPELAKIKLQLGKMYFNLGSYSMAKSYFERASHSTHASDDIKTEAQDYLERL